ncbi:hypothetical protein SAMN05428959_1011142 [Duganella sp. CF517]|uniref:hypothetical protein n=1 Tax=Duganella sp. CF517 TaxID=1881038 RepID=UPI0008D4CD6B|nr:hypothetical protein [Duganella sp. CF517]SEN31565.1 hypothetical protein SAMN05428959_1011142 [Duganella sp. CF517]
MDQEIKHLQRLRPSKRAICTAIGFAATLIVGWSAGYDMLERGVAQAVILIEALLIAVLVWTCPIWPKEQRNGQ